MSRLVTAGNVVIPGTITVTVNNSHITPLDDLRVILNITGAGAVTLDDGTDTTQRVEIMNKSATSCNLTYTAVGGSVTVQLGTNKGARLLWVGGYWKATLGGLITGTDANGNPIEYLAEATIDTKVAPQQYMTTEQLTGEYWTDGKPIYRNTYPFTVSDFTVSTDGNRRMYSRSVSVPNVKHIIKVNGYFTMQNSDGTSVIEVAIGSTHMIPGTSPANYPAFGFTVIKVTNDSLQNQATFTINGMTTPFLKDGVMTVYYTKTTD